MTNIAELVLPANTGAATYAGILEMSASEWTKVRDNPRQRDTETRAKRAKHLRAPHPTHCRVNAARLPGGELYKLDGHTRAFLWANGTLEKPPKVYADIWECRSIGDVKELYSTYDSSAAVETATDQVFGAVRDGRLDFESEVLKSLRFANGMRVSSEMLFGQTHTRDLSIYELVEYWTPELNLLDQCEATRKRFHSGVIAAALLTFRRYGSEGLRFWRSFAIGGGNKIDGERDAVQALEERMESMRGDKQITGRGNIAQVVRVCLSAFDAHLHERTYSGQGSGIKAWRDNTLEKFLSNTAKTKRRW